VRQGIGEHRHPDRRRHSDEQCCPVTCVTLRNESAEVTLLKLLIPRPEPDRTAPRPSGFRPAFGASSQTPASLTRNGSAVSGGYLLTEVTLGHDHSGEPQDK
jgi:hypothetical protein